MQITIPRRLYRHRHVVAGMAMLLLLLNAPAKAQSINQMQPTWLESTTTAGTVQGSKTYYYRFYTRSGALHLQGQFPAGYQANATVAAGRTTCHFSFKQGEAQAAESCNLPNNKLALLRLELTADSARGGSFNLQLNQVATAETASAVAADTSGAVETVAPTSMAVAPNSSEYQTLEYTWGPQPVRFLPKNIYSSVNDYIRDYRAKIGPLTLDTNQIPPGIKGRLTVSVYDDPTDGEQELEFRQKCVFEIHNPKFDLQGAVVFTTTDEELSVKFRHMNDKQKEDKLLTEFTKSPCIISEARNRLRPSFSASYRSGSRQETVRLFIHNVIPLKWINRQYRIQEFPFNCSIVGCFPGLY